MDRFVDLTVSAVLLAGLYATMAYGLGLIYGVLRLVNLAHAGVIMAGAYLGWILHRALGLDPFASIPLVVAASFAFGVLLYVALVRHLPRGAAGGPQSLLLLFGVWLVMRNAAYLLFTGDDRVVRTAYSTRAVTVLGGQVPVNRVAVFAILVLPSYLTAAVGFAMLVLVLVVRPGGLFGQRVLG